MTPEQKQFAYKVATALNDLHSLALHESFVRRYPREYLEEQLRKTLERPEHEIYTSRARYYTSIVTKNAPKFNRY